MAKTKMKLMVFIGYDYRASLKTGKVYRCLSDVKAEKKGFVRILNDYDEDYLFPKEYFIPIVDLLPWSDIVTHPKGCKNKKS